MLNLGYGYLDADEIMVNGNLKKMPEPHVYRS
jgi:hypothetical protein